VSLYLHVRTRPTYYVHGFALRERREAIGLSLRELARRAAVSPTYLSRLERGAVESSVSKELADRLVAVLGEPHLCVLNRNASGACGVCGRST
jgi:transcriptional regulator with XRE-family HTH domain